MDLMYRVVERFADAGSGPLLERLAAAIDHARRASIPVIHVRVAFREGYPDVSPNNKSFSALSQAGGLREEDTETSIVAELAPAPSDVVVTKRRVSAFTGSDLEVVLRSQDIDTLVLTGIATSGVVLSTLREAADRDYRLVVPAASTPTPRSTGC